MCVKLKWPRVQSPRARLSSQVTGVRIQRLNKQVLNFMNSHRPWDMLDRVSCRTLGKHRDKRSGIDCKIQSRADLRLWTRAELLTCCFISGDLSGVSDSYTSSLSVFEGTNTSCWVSVTVQTHPYTCVNTCWINLPARHTPGCAPLNTHGRPYTHIHD